MKMDEKQSGIFIELLEQRYSTLHQKCTSQKKENDARRAVAMTTIMPWEF